MAVGGAKSNKSYGMPSEYDSDDVEAVVNYQWSQRYQNKKEAAK
jgi:hypothetical protein